MSKDFVATFAFVIVFFSVVAFVKAKENPSSALTHLKGLSSVNGILGLLMLLTTCELIEA